MAITPRLRHISASTLMALLLVSGTHVADARPFTVADSIGMTEIAEPAATYQQDSGHDFKRSPDGRRFVVVLRRGHLDTDENEYELVMFDVSDVLHAVNASDGRAMPRGHTLISMRASSEKRAIESARWLDNHRVAFIGRTGGEVGQVYLVDVRSGFLQKLTDCTEGIFTFDISLAGRLVYSTPVFPDWRERNRRGYVVEAPVLDNVIRSDPRDSFLQDMGFFVKDLRSGATTSLNVGRNWVATAWGSLALPNEIAISPDGRWAVVLAIPDFVPESWAEYAFLKKYLSHIPMVPGVEGHTRTALDELVPAVPAVPRAYTAKQFYLVDLANAATRALIDAPGSIGWGTHVRWSSDSGRVLLAPTYLPLDGVEGKERARRQVAPAIAEVDIASGKVLRLTDRSEAIENVEWLGSDRVLVEWRRAEAGKPAAATFRKVGDRWIDSTPPAKTKQERLGLRIQEDMNTPPQIVAIDRVTGRQRAITALNPQLHELMLGRMEVFEWHDRFGRNYRGGLVLPPYFRADRQYPVVLQTYGFFPDEYLVDGSARRSTAYAARALAGKDIVVLQMPFGPVSGAELNATWEWDRDAEGPQFVAMMEGAIDSLSAKRVIDRKRVGLIGFSHEGARVQYAITFSGYSIAAATIADSFQLTPFTYAVSYGVPYPAGALAQEDEGLIGAPLWGEGIATWLERSPAFHLERIRTPLRLEHLSTKVPEFWDTFVQLKRHRRPVEMIQIPTDAHQLERPITRYVSQQGNVDWFAFWLKGEIDPDPEKAAQYARWHVLRKQRDALELASRGTSE